MRDLVKQEDKDYFYSNESYESLVESFEYEIIYNKSVGDYQGTIYWVLKDGDRYGFLQEYYGSCSGCDCLAGCYNYEQVVQLRNEMHANIKWYNSLAELQGDLDKDRLEGYYNYEEGQGIYWELMKL
jgi:hypothetical protein